MTQEINTRFNFFQISPSSEVPLKFSRPSGLEEIMKLLGELSKQDPLQGSEQN